MLSKQISVILRSLMALTSSLSYFSEFVSNHKEQVSLNNKKEFPNSPTKSETSSHFLRNLLLFFFFCFFTFIN